MKLTTTTAATGYLGCGFDRRAVFKQQFDDLDSVFLGGDMQRSEAILCTQQPHWLSRGSMLK